MSAWPPANFSDWPGTRSGAIIYDVILLITWSIGFIVWRSKMNKFDNDTIKSENKYIIKDYCYSCWPHGICVITINKNDNKIYIEHWEESKRGCCCIDFVLCNDNKRCDISINDIKHINYESCCIGSTQNGILNVIIAIMFGCGIGLFLHFIPCIWWTCDWSANDGQGIRGGIWFITWIITTIFLLIKSKEKSLIIETNFDTIKICGNNTNSLYKHIKQNYPDI